jgi:hypothetical protein
MDLTPCSAQLHQQAVAMVVQPGVMQAALMVAQAVQVAVAVLDTQAEAQAEQETLHPLHLLRVSLEHNHSRVAVFGVVAAVADHLLLEQQLESLTLVVLVLLIQ